MNALAELENLQQMFPDEPPLIAKVEHIPSASTPEPYKTLLVHDHHMTVNMESFHHCVVAVRVLSETLLEHEYRRQILLLKEGSDQVVQYGLVRLHLEYVDPPVREKILSGKIPLGRVLIEHNVLRQIDLGAILRITSGPRLCEYFNCPNEAVTYGRLATIFCDGRPAIDLLEIAAPV